MRFAQQEVVHDVLFAENDDELIGVAGDRLAGALAAGHFAVAIVTSAHRQPLMGRVSAAGLDPDDARATGSLLVLDAEETLARLTPHGTFDRAEFDRLVGHVIHDRATQGRVFAFGEMVALLFDAQRPQEAMDLEAAWSEMLQDSSLDVLCAYPGFILDDPRQAAHVGSLCALHSDVVARSGYQRSWTLADERAAGSDARRLVSNALRARGVPEDAFYDTLSVVTELVGSAVAQGGAPVSLEVAIDDALVGVRVADSSPVAARPSRPAGRKRVSRGLRLVEELAHRWGVEGQDAGKVVWAELSR